MEGEAGPLGPVPPEFVFDNGLDLVFHCTGCDHSGCRLVGLHRDVDRLLEHSEFRGGLDLSMSGENRCDVFETAPGYRSPDLANVVLLAGHRVDLVAVFRETFEP